jgi:hypothetical protein
MTLPATLTDYPAFLKAREYDAEYLRMVAQASGLVEGIAPFDVSSIITTSMPGDFKATTAASGMNITVPGGRAWVKGDTRATQGLYYCYASANTTVTMAAAHGANPRVDAIILQVEDADATGSNNRFRVTKQDGTATVGATLSNLTGAPGQSGGPSLQDGAMVLAYVLVPAAFAGPFVDATHLLDYRNLALPRQACIMTKSAQSIAAGSYVKFTLGTTVVDNNRMADTTNNRIYIRVAGVYNIVANYVSASAGTAGVNRLYAIYKNGSLLVGENDDAIGNSNTDRGAPSTTALLAAGDYIEAYLYAYTDTMNWDAQLAVTRVA